MTDTRFKSVHNIFFSNRSLDQSTFTFLLKYPVKNDSVHNKPTTNILFSDILKCRDIVVGLYWFLLAVAGKINCQTYDELWENIDWLLPTTFHHQQKKLEN